jgi:hypothetical protein
MTDRILIVEQDPQNKALWRYGLADEDGQLPADAFVLSSDRAVSGPPADDYHAASLWTTAILLVRQAGDRDPDRLRLTYRPSKDSPEPPPRPPDRPSERSTGGKSKGAGETLGERAERQP